MSNENILRVRHGRREPTVAVLQMASRGTHAVWMRLHKALAAKSPATFRADVESALKMLERVRTEGILLLYSETELRERRNRR